MASLKLLAAIDAYATAINSFVIAWQIGSEHSMKAFDTLDQAEQYLYTQVAPHKVCQYRYLAIPDRKD